MSNFICSECGMINIDCGYAGYKTPKEIELEKKVHILNEANMKLENELGHFADLSKKVERLQEQLKKLKQENTIHNNKAKKRRIHINNLKNENNQLREQLKEKNIKLNELRHQRNEANEALKSLIAGDKNTLYHLNKILPEVKNNKVTYDYMKMIVEDFEDDLKEIEKRAVK